MMHMSGWFLEHPEDTFRVLPSHEGIREVSLDLTPNCLGRDMKEECLRLDGWRAQPTKGKDANNCVRLCIQSYEKTGGLLTLCPPGKVSDMLGDFLTMPLAGPVASFGAHNGQEGLYNNAPSFTFLVAHSSRPPSPSPSGSGSSPGLARRQLYTLGSL